MLDIGNRQQTIAKLRPKKENNMKLKHITSLLTRKLVVASIGAIVASLMATTLLLVHDPQTVAGDAVANYSNNLSYGSSDDPKPDRSRSGNRPSGRTERSNSSKWNNRSSDRGGWWDSSWWGGKYSKSYSFKIWSYRSKWGKNWASNKSAKQNSFPKFRFTDPSENDSIHPDIAEICVSVEPNPDKISRLKSSTILSKRFYHSMIKHSERMIEHHLKFGNTEKALKTCQKRADRVAAYEHFFGPYPTS